LYLTQITVLMLFVLNCNSLAKVRSLPAHCSHRLSHKRPQKGR